MTSRHDTTLPGGQPAAPSGARLARRVVHAVSSLFNLAAFTVLFLMLMVGLYALWDVGAVYEGASSSKWQAYIPTEEDHGSYDELAAANPDVVGWLDVYGTNINYPLTYSQDQYYYLNHDARGAYSLSGSLFLDRASSPDFTDFATIVYGHHMDRDAMFGQIGAFADADFFQAHRYGTLYVGRGPRAGTLLGLDFFEFLPADAYDGSIYRAGVAGVADCQAYLDRLASQATQVREGVSVTPADQVVLLSTCSSDATNGRSILVGKVEDQVQADTFAKAANLGVGVDALSGLFSFPWTGWAALVAIACLVAALVLRRKGPRSEGGDAR